MGTAAIILGSAALGIGAAAMSKKGKAKYASEVHSTMVPSKPAVPEAPSAATPEAAEAGSATTSNVLMEEARERELQQAALRKRQAQEVFTSGLGASGLAVTGKKDLLGG